MNVGEYVQCLAEIHASCLSSSIYLVFCVWLILLVNTLTLITPTNVRYYRPQHFIFAADGPDISGMKSTSGVHVCTIAWMCSKHTNSEV